MFLRFPDILHLTRSSRFSRTLAALHNITFCKRSENIGKQISRKSFHSIDGWWGEEIARKLWPQRSLFMVKTFPFDSYSESAYVIELLDEAPARPKQNDNIEKIIFLPRPNVMKGGRRKKLSSLKCTSGKSHLNYYQDFSILDFE